MPAYAGQLHPMFLGSRPAVRGPAPAASGFQWPSAANTPSVSGNVLTYYPNVPTSYAAATTTLTASPGDLYTSSNGQVIQDLDITGAVVVNHNDVIIRRCRIHDFYWSGIYIDTGVQAGHPVIVEDCLIDTPNPAGINGSSGASSDHYTVRRSRIRDVENGFSGTSNILVEYCFVYPMYNSGGAHSDGFQTSTSAVISNITFRHNTVFSRGETGSGEGDGSSCFNCANDSTSFTNVFIDHKFMAGGSYTIYGPHGVSDNPGTNVQITNNHLGTNYNSDVGTFGHWLDVEDEAVVSGNIKVDASDNFISNLP